MKKFLLYLFLITALILPAGVALSAWGVDIVVTENGTESHDMLGCNITANIDFMEAEGFIGDNGTDTLVERAGSDKPHMLADDRIMFAIPVSGNSTNNLDFTAGNTPLLDYFYTIPGYGGSCNATDEDSIELGDNFTVEQSGWWDTDVGSEKFAVYKKGAFKTFIASSENITSAIMASSNTTVTRVPTADGDVNGTWDTAPRWDDVDETVPNDADFMTGTTDGGGHCLFTFTVFDLLDYYEVESLTVYIRGIDEPGIGDNNFYEYLKVNGSYYQGTSHNPGGAFTTYSHEWLTNPDTGEDWTIADINGIGSNPLEQFGVYSTDLDPDIKVSMVYAEVAYHDATIVSATGVSSGELVFTTKGNPAFLGRGIDIGADTDLPPITDDLQLNMPLWSTYLTGSPFDSVDANAHTCTVANALWTSSGRSFDGAGDGITIPDDASLDFGTDNFTIEMWVWVDVIGVADEFRDLINKITGGDAGWRFIAREASGQFQIFVLAGGANNSILLANEFETWNHFVFMRRSGELGGYLNGVDGGRWWAGAADVDNADDIIIGLGDLPDFEGVIGEVRIYDEALTQPEILQNYNATKWKYIGSHTDDDFDYVYSGVSVPDNGNDWTFYQNNVLPYSDNTSIEVDGVLELWFRPIDIISGTTLPDRATSVANDGTFIWGSNPSGVAITLGALESDYVATEAPPLETPDVVPVLTPPVTTADAAKLAGLADHPLTPAIHAISEVTGIYELLWWWFGTLVLALLLFGVSFKWVKNLMLSGVLFCAVVGYGVTIGIYDFWVIFAIIVILLGCVVLQNRRATG